MQRLGAALEIPPGDDDIVRNVADQIFQAIADAGEVEADWGESSVHAGDTKEANMRFFQEGGEDAEEVAVEGGGRNDAEAREISVEVDTFLQMSVVEGDGTDIEGQRSRPRLPIHDRVLRTFWFDWLNRLWA